MSLAKVLKMLRIYEPERILLVFGCGGNRAGSRRSGMGRVAGELANLTIITSDNPRWEEPAKIMADVEEGIKETSGAYRMIQDREGGSTLCGGNGKTRGYPSDCGKGT